MSNIIIYGGGTFSPVRNHLSLAAMSFGNTAKWLKNRLPQAHLRLTKMADSTEDMVTNLDVIKDVDTYLCDPYTKVIIMSAALCDYHGSIGDIRSGHHAERLQTRSCDGYKMYIKPSIKVIDHIRALRPDITIIGFKTTTDQHPNVQVGMAESMGVDLVLANDVVTRHNVLVGSDGLEAHGERAFLLSLLVRSLNDRVVKFESGKVIWIQLDANRYIPKHRAMSEAEKVYDFEGKFRFVEWHDQVEGLAIIEKVV